MQYGNEPGFRYTPGRGRRLPSRWTAAATGTATRAPTSRSSPRTSRTRDTGETIFPPYAIHNFSGGYKVAFVGMTLEGTDLIVSPDGIADIEFLDEAASVNALVPELQARGRRGHRRPAPRGRQRPAPSNGGRERGSDQPHATAPTGATPRRSCRRWTTRSTSSITGHTNWAVNCLIDGKVVTGAASQGRLITDIDAKLDKATGDFVPGSIMVNNRIVTQDVAEGRRHDGAHRRVQRVRRADRRRGRRQRDGGDGPRTSARRACESTLGRLIADAQLADRRQRRSIAFMNPGGIRANLDAGPVTHGEAFAVQPFSNIVTTMDLTGARSRRCSSSSSPSSATGALRSSSPTVLLPSTGFTYTWNGTGPAGDRVDPATIKLNGVHDRSDADVPRGREQLPRDGWGRLPDPARTARTG